MVFTKVQVPPARARLVERARLAAALDSVWQARLLLVSAPAGFGKTTLLVEWAHLHRGQVAWLALDATDDDPLRFWSYVVAALQQIHPEVGAAALAVVRSPQPPPVAALLPTLLNDLAAVPGDIALVLDDYHMIEAPAIHEALADLLEHAPPNFHLVLAARADPPLPLARLRARAQMAELSGADLCFDAQEAGAFLRDLMGLQLRGEHVAALAASTEGWAAGLQLAALALRARRGRPDSEPAVVNAFDGSHRFVVDYLVDEVLGRQPKPVQTFLLQTAVLDRLCGPLCDVVTERHDTAATLEELERANLFLVALDEDRYWYRYHHLFADALRAHVRRTQPAVVPLLYQRAAAWCVAAELSEEAVGYALAGSAFSDAAGQIELIARAVIQRGETALLQKWLDALPADLLETRPRLGLALVWCAVARGQLEAVEPRVQAVDQALGVPVGQEDPETLSLRGELAAVRATLASMQQNAAGVVGLAQTALETLRDDDHFLRGLVAFSLGNAHFWQGDMPKARDQLAQAAALSRSAHNLPIALSALNTLALVHESQAELQDAAALYRQVLRTGAPDGRPLPLAAVASAHIGLGGLLREWNELDLAVDALRLGIELARGFESSGVLGGGYYSLARALHAQGQVEAAFAQLDQAEAAFRLGYLTAGVAAVEGYRALLQLGQGDLATAARWSASRRDALGPLAHDRDPPDDAAPIGPIAEFELVVLARIMLAQGEVTEAERLLVRLLDAAESTNRTASVIKLRAVHAVALHERGHTRRALAELNRALTLAESGGYVRLFVDEGPLMAGLLRQVVDRGVAWAYPSRVLAAFAQAPSGVPAGAGLVEPLTAREHEVVRLLAAGLSNAAIADELVVVVGTVKRHLNSAYGKLGATSRTQAVARARDLGLV